MIKQDDFRYVRSKLNPDGTSYQEYSKYPDRGFKRKNPWDIDRKILKRINADPHRKLAIVENIVKWLFLGILVGVVLNYIAGGLR